MTSIEELNRKEAEEIELVREKYARLREHQRSLCVHEFDPYQFWRNCKHCGADMSAQST